MNRTKNSLVFFFSGRIRMRNSGFGIPDGTILQACASVQRTSCLNSYLFVKADFLCLPPR